MVSITSVPKNASTESTLKSEEIPMNNDPMIMSSKKQMRRKKTSNTFKACIFKILKNIHSDIGISQTAMEIMNSFIIDMSEKISNEAYKLASHSKKATISTKEIETAVKLVIRGDLAKHAVHEGPKPSRTLINPRLFWFYFRFHSCHTKPIKINKLI